MKLINWIKGIIWPEAYIAGAFGLLFAISINAPRWIAWGYLMLGFIVWAYKKTKI
jgi:hypothetical protein